MMRRKGVICGVEAQDGHRGLVQFLAWTRIMVIIFAGFVTKLDGREALVKLADCPRLEEKRGMAFKQRGDDKAKAEGKGILWKGPYLQDVVDVGHFL